MDRSIDQGLVGRVCPQANPAWELIAAQFDPAYLTGKPFNASAAQAAIAAAADSPPSIDPRTTEDCLFLDVIVPEQIFNKGSNSSSGKNAAAGAPVLVWIYGGGYTAGEKTGNGVYNPAGLIKASQINRSEGVVYVALNYRVRLSAHWNERNELRAVAWGFRFPCGAYSAIGRYCQRGTL